MFKKEPFAVDKMIGRKEVSAENDFHTLLAQLL